jgi:multiple sugar transport system ATP-binding protein
LVEELCVAGDELFRSAAAPAAGPRSAGTAALRLAGVSKRFGETVALSCLDLAVEEGEFLVLLGPSGCGKTSVLRLVAGLEEPTSGTIELGGQVMNGIDPKDRDVAMVFQSYALYPHLSVRRNIEFPLRARRLPAAERERLTATVATSLQLETLLERRPAQLSGGQRQRVALARAMVRRPRVFLMDEPLSNLDAQLRVEMRAELIELHRRLGTTIVYVTHDQVEAMTMGHRIAILDHGVLRQIDRPQVIHDRPANTFVAGFLGSPAMNLLRAGIEVAGETSYARVGAALIVLCEGAARAASASRTTEIVLGVRPEHLVVDPEGPLRARITLVESLGHEHHLRGVTADGQRVVVRTGETARRPSIGEDCGLSIAGEPHLFDASSGNRLVP